VHDRILTLAKYLAATPAARTVNTEQTISIKQHRQITVRFYLTQHSFISLQQN